MKIIDYKKVDITDAEYAYYESLVKKLSKDGKDGKEYFKDVFDVNQRGQIMVIKTQKSVPWAVLFFVQQLMINQRMRHNDELLNKNEKLIERLEKLERKLAKYE